MIVDTTQKFFIEFANDTETFTLEFNTYDTSIGHKWYEALKKALLNDNPIRENDRLYNFPNDFWSEEKIISKINECIVIINNYKPFIDMVAIVGSDQDHFNRLHKYFERMRGNVAHPNEYFMSAPPDIKLAIESYNTLIHRLEGFLRNKAKNTPTTPSARIVVTFTDMTRLPMADEDFDNVTTIMKFGEVYLNYCEVGKSLLDVYHDKDEIVGDASIIPQRFYSPGIMIRFRDFHIGMTKFNLWWDEHEPYFNSLGFIKGDKTLSIGYIPVAMLSATNYSKLEILNKIGKFETIHRVYI